MSNPSPSFVRVALGNKLPPTRALMPRWRGGKVRARTRDGSIITFSVARWQVLPVIVDRVLRKGTTARGLVGLV